MDVIKVYLKREVLHESRVSVKQAKNAAQVILSYRIVHHNCEENYFL